MIKDIDRGGDIKSCALAFSFSDWRTMTTYTISPLKSYLNDIGIEPITSVLQTDAWT